MSTHGQVIPDPECELYRGQIVAFGLLLIFMFRSLFMNDAQLVIQMQFSTTLL